MDLRRLKTNWDRFAEVDPMWAILSSPRKRWNRWSADEFFTSGETETHQLMARIQALPVQPGRHRALDFGCGIGRVTQALASHFTECWGVDISDQMVNRARAHNRQTDRCRYVVNETDALPMFDSAAFDLVYTNLVLQHMENRFVRSYLEEFLRILRPGGLLVCQIPTRRRDFTGPWLSSWRQFGTRWLLRTVARRAHLDGALRAATGTVKHTLGRTGIAHLLYRLHLLQNPAVMEMHPFERNELEQFLRDRQAEILRVYPNDGAGPEFESFQYFVTRAGPHGASGSSPLSTSP